MGLGTSLLIHNMWLSIAGNADDLRKAADDLDVLMESNRQIYLERANVTEEELIDMMNKETYLTPEKAVEMGFADEVDGSKDADPEDAMQAMQQQLQQMRRTMAEQKEFRTELRELYRTAMKKDDEDDTDDEDNNSDEDNNGDTDDTDDTDDNSDEDDTDDDKKKKQKKKTNPKENGRSLAALLAKAAAKNLEKR